MALIQSVSDVERSLKRVHLDDDGARKELDRKHSELMKIRYQLARTTDDLGIYELMLKIYHQFGSKYMLNFILYDDFLFVHFRNNAKTFLSHIIKNNAVNTLKTLYYLMLDEEKAEFRKYALVAESGNHRYTKIMRYAFCNEQWEIVEFCINNNFPLTDHNGHKISGSDFLNEEHSVNIPDHIRRLLKSEYSIEDDNTCNCEKERREKKKYNVHGHDERKQITHGVQNLQTLNDPHIEELNCAEWNSHLNVKRNIFDFSRRKTHKDFLKMLFAYLERSPNVTHISIEMNYFHFQHWNKFFELVVMIERIFEHTHVNEINLLKCNFIPPMYQALRKLHNKYFEHRQTLRFKDCDHVMNKEVLLCAFKQQDLWGTPYSYPHQVAKPTWHSLKKALLERYRENPDVVIPWYIIEANLGNVENERGNIVKYPIVHFDETGEKMRSYRTFDGYDVVEKKREMYDVYRKTKATYATYRELYDKFYYGNEYKDLQTRCGSGYPDTIHSRIDRWLPFWFYEELLQHILSYVKSKIPPETKELFESMHDSFKLTFTENDI